jgi:glycosyltransferase involved in cell wall biosynthesis
MQKHTVSLCMIVKNEEKYLDRCLKSVQGKVDEIIIVDTGSTDKTIEIAEKYGSIVKHFIWINDFAAARNYSIEGVESEYILVLDADEYLDDGTDLQKDLEKGKDFYRLTIKNQSNSGQIVFSQNVRLFKSGIGLKYSGKLHEHLNTYEEDNGYVGIESDGVIHHAGYLPEVISEKGKKKRNYDIMIKELSENPTGYSYFNMGLVYMNDAKYEEALGMFKKSYPLSKTKSYVKALLVRMGECLGLLKRNEEGIKLMDDAIAVFSNYTDLYYGLGMLYVTWGYYKDAELIFKKCLELGEKTETITTEGVGSYMANYQLALIYGKKGRNGDAFDEAFKAITKKRSYTPSLSLYLKLMQRAGIQPEEIKEHLSKVYIIDTVEEVKALVHSLYEIRHPLMNKLGFVFEDERLTDLRAVALMLDKQYDKAVEEWVKVEVISKANGLDAMVMCLLSKNKPLMDKVKECFNFNNKEWKFISRVLLKENIEKPYLTSETEKVLIDISEYLLNISEFELFEYISGFLLQCSAETQEKLAAMLLENGYADTALELMGLVTEKYSNRYESYMLLGDIYTRLNNKDKALECLNRALCLKDEYPIYERIYDFYEMMGNYPKMNNIKNIMKDKFPLSIWLRNN